MNQKKLLSNEIVELMCVINHFKKNNQVVIERWVMRFGYSFEMIVLEINEKIELYNRKYGKRFGQISFVSMNG